MSIRGLKLLQFLLFYPHSGTPAGAVTLEALLKSVDVAALVFLRGPDETEQDYADRVTPLAQTAQSHDCAALLDNLPGLVKKMAADGVHMTSGQRGFADAATALKPDYIVGAGDVHSHHEAMLRGEAGADYLLFGDPANGTAQADLEDAQWWSETFQIDAAIVADPSNLAPALAAGTEFIAFGADFWALPDPAGLLAGLIEASE